jgi:hypothetical protein
MTGQSAQSGAGPAAGGAMDTAAVIQHEMFASYVRAGFTREEALQILIAIITSATAAGNGTP